MNEPGRPPWWDLAGLIMYWLSQRSRLFRQNLLAVVLIVVGLAVAHEVGLFP